MEASRTMEAWSSHCGEARGLQKYRFEGSSSCDCIFQYPSIIGFRLFQGVQQPSAEQLLKLKLMNHFSTTAKTSNPEHSVTTAEVPTVESWGRKFDSDQLASIASFQYRAVMHALSCEISNIHVPDNRLRSEAHSGWTGMFRNVVPRVERVTYSTCSIHVDENEAVVKKVLESQDAFVLERALPSFRHRGLNSVFPEGSIRTIHVFCFDCRIY